MNHNWLSAPVSRSIALALVAIILAAPAHAGDTLIIVTPRALQASLTPFIAHKRERRAVEVLILEDVLATSPGTDDPEKLKHALYDAWKKHAAGYVLLVGDADVMPVRYMVLDRVTAPAFDYAFYPSDLYYADLARAGGSFDTWNSAAEGYHATYFGEVHGEKNKSGPINYDAIDYRPEVGLGRWPVSTPEETSAVSARAIEYEVAFEKGEVAKTAALVHVGGWVDARERVNGWGARLGEGWRIERRFYKDANPAFDTPAPTAAEVIGVINAGASLVLHAGHGTDTSWDQCIDVNSIGTLTSKGRVVMLSAGCTTARFATLPPYEAYEDVSGKAHAGTDAGEVFTQPPLPPSCYAKGAFNRTGIGERLVREGAAVAYVGCNTGSQPCALTLQEGFVDAIASAAKTQRPALVGDCWKHAVAYYWEHEGLATIAPSESWYPASIFFQGMKFMLFGDPTAPVSGR